MASPITHQAPTRGQWTAMNPVIQRVLGTPPELVANLKPYDLAAIRAPTLLISARDDGYGTYASAEYATSQIVGAKFIGFEKGGHLLASPE